VTTSAMAREIDECADVVVRIVRSRPATRDIAERLGARSLPRLAVCRDLLGHLLERPHDREGKQSELVASRDRGRVGRGRRHPARRMRFLHGLGRNGKTTMLNAQRKVLGEYATSTQASTIMVKKHDDDRRNEG